MIPDTRWMLCTEAFTAEWACGRANCSHCPSVKYSLLTAYLIYSHCKVPIAVISIHSSGQLTPSVMMSDSCIHSFALPTAFWEKFMSHG